MLDLLLSAFAFGLGLSAGLVVGVMLFGFAASAVLWAFGGKR